MIRRSLVLPLLALAFAGCQRTRPEWFSDTAYIDDEVGALAARIGERMEDPDWAHAHWGW